MDKWIDLESLPHKKSRINWKESIGERVQFRYDDISGIITLKRLLPDNTHIVIEYKGKEYQFKKNKLSRVPFGVMLGRIYFDYKYNIGEQIKKDERSISAKATGQYTKATTNSSKTRFYQLKCDRCQQLYERNENAVERTGCPICSNHQIVIGVNDLWSTHEFIAKQLKNPEDGYKTSYGKNKKMDWICPFCKQEAKGLIPAQVLNAINSYVPCKCCSDGYSFPNKFFYNLLKKTGVLFIPEKTFLWGGLCRYDFYIPEFEMIVELHGAQHYDKRFPEIAQNDVYKRDLALSNNIKHYIEIDCRRSNARFIFDNLNKNLSDFFDFSGIDIDEIAMLAQKKISEIVLEVLEKNGYDVGITANQMSIHRATVSGYLNTAIRAGKLSEQYVRESQKQNKIKFHYQKEAKPIRNIDTGEVFGSNRQVEEYLNCKGEKFSPGSLKQGIDRKGTSYGYHWEHVSRLEFNETKKANNDLAYGDFFEDVSL